MSFKILASAAALLAALTGPALAKTDLSGCTYYDSVVTPGHGPAYATRIWFVEDTREICEFLDCGGGRAPPKTTVPGCPLYEGTETYSPRFLPASTTSAPVSTQEPEPATTEPPKTDDEPSSEAATTGTPEPDTTNSSEPAQSTGAPSPSSESQTSSAAASDTNTTSSTESQEPSGTSSSDSAESAATTSDAEDGDGSGAGTMGQPGVIMMVVLAGLVSLVALR